MLDIVSLFVKKKKKKKPVQTDLFQCDQDAKQIRDAHF